MATCERIRFRICRLMLVLHIGTWVKQLLMTDLTITPSKGKFGLVSISTFFFFFFLIQRAESTFQLLRLIIYILTI